MDEKLENKIYGRFPYFVYSSGMTHGYVPLECGDGWFDIIWSMCEEIEQDIRRTHPTFTFRIIQLKEKWGDLTVYTVGGNGSIDKILRKYKIKSLETCELCGKPGKLRTKGWHQVRCEECDNVPPV